MTITLTAQEIDILMLQDPATKEDGGYQRLLIKLQEKLYRNSLDLSDEDLERIPKYAFDYGNGGWENRLKGIFQNSLGENLGR